MSGVWKNPDCAAEECREARLGSSPRQQYAEIPRNFANLPDRHITPCWKLNPWQRLTIFGFAISALVLIAGAQTVDRSPGAAPNIAASWYPLQPGDTWTYRRELLTGDVAHPDSYRGTVEETIVSAVPAPEMMGTLVTKRIRVLDDVLSPGFIRANGPRKLTEVHLLIRRDCVYVLGGPQDRNDLLRGNLPADYCFPMAKGMTWGKVSTTSPAGEYVWNVIGLNADPFGVPGRETFHLTSHGGSGTSMDRWFEEGVGLLQEVIEHHGTYDEDREQLLRATIHGKTTICQLTPARTVPLSEGDCRRPFWRHFARADGTAFRSFADCVGYTSHQK